MLIRERVHFALRFRESIRPDFLRSVAALILAGPDVAHRGAGSVQELHDLA